MLTGMPDLEKSVLRHARSGPEQGDHPFPHDDSGEHCPDIACARQTLGWRPGNWPDDVLIPAVDCFQIHRCLQGI